MMTELRYPPAVWRPIVSHGGPMTAQHGLVEHITTNDASPFGFFSNRLNRASSHLWLSAAGAFEQYVDLRLGSWAQAGGNRGWTSCEVSGKPGTTKTPAQVHALAELFAWGHGHPELRWPLQLTDDVNGSGLGWHGMGGTAWGGHYDCPGQPRLAQRLDVLSLALGLDHAPPAEGDPDPMARLIRPVGSTAIYATDGVCRWQVPSPPILADLMRAGIYGEGKVIEVGQQTIDALPLVAPVPTSRTLVAPTR